MSHPDRTITKILSEPAISRLIGYFGIERVALLQELDVVKVPIVSVICPESMDVIKVYSGRGDSLRRAVIGAIMECVERTTSRWQEDKIQTASVADLRARQIPFYPPSAFTERKHPHWDEFQNMPWVAARSLRDGQNYWVPADLVFWGKNRPPFAPVFEAVSTNGLAAHFSRVAAVQKGVREIVERHVISDIELAAGDRDMSVLLGMAKGAGIQCGNVISSFRYNVDYAVDCAPVAETLAARIVAEFAAHGISVYTKLLRSFSGLYVVGCASAQRGYDGRLIACAGYGAQPDLGASVEDAVLEMCQSRVTDLHGMREDCGIDDKGRSAADACLHWLLQPSNGSVNGAPEAPDQTWFANCVGAFKDVLIYHFLPDDEISTVRVLAPGSQTWHITAGQSSTGSY